MQQRLIQSVQQSIQQGEQRQKLESQIPKVNEDMTRRDNERQQHFTFYVTLE